MNKLAKTSNLSFSILNRAFLNNNRMLVFNHRRLFSSKKTDIKSTSTESSQVEKKEGKNQLKDNWHDNPYFNLSNREKISRKEVRQYLMPFVFHKDSMHYFYKSMFLLLGSKGLAVASPYILKLIVDTMTLAGQIDFTHAALGIGVFGLTRIMSNAF